jgi:hypothetical protein
VNPDSWAWAGTVVRYGLDALLCEGLASMTCDAIDMSDRVLPTLDRRNGAGDPCCHFDVQAAAEAWHKTQIFIAITYSAVIIAMKWRILL